MEFRFNKMKGILLFVVLFVFCDKIIIVSDISNTLTNQNIMLAFVFRQQIKHFLLCRYLADNKYFYYLDYVLICIIQLKERFD